MFSYQHLLVLQCCAVWVVHGFIISCYECHQPYMYSKIVVSCTVLWSRSGHTGGWWHLNWGGRARGNGWWGIGGMVSNTLNTWFPCVWCDSICSVPAIIMSRPSLSSLHWVVHDSLYQRTRAGWTGCTGWTCRTQGPSAPSTAVGRTPWLPPLHPPPPPHQRSPRGGERALVPVIKVALTEPKYSVNHFLIFKWYGLSSCNSSGTNNSVQPLTNNWWLVVLSYFSLITKISPKKNLSMSIYDTLHDLCDPERCWTQTLRGFLRSTSE